MQPAEPNWQKRIFYLLLIMLVIVPCFAGGTYLVWHHQEQMQRESLRLAADQVNMKSEQALRQGNQGR